MTVMRRFLTIAAAVGLLAVGAGAYIWFSGGSGEPTTQLTTPPLAADTTTPPATEADPTTTTTGVASSELAFVLDSAESVASFELGEILNGAPNQVVGTTREVAGQVRFDPADLETVTFSEILINARTFATDSSLRDRAIRSPVILGSGSDEFELIRFRPRAVEGLPAAVEIGDRLEFRVVGDLSIKGTTREVAFEVTAHWESGDRLSGRAVAIVERADFGIGIPNVPSVADVDEEVELVLEFVARTE